MERRRGERLGAALLPGEALAGDEVQGHVDDVHQAVGRRRVLDAVGERLGEHHAVAHEALVAAQRV